MRHVKTTQANFTLSPTCFAMELRQYHEERSNCHWLPPMARHIGNRKNPSGPKLLTAASPRDPKSFSVCVTSTRSLRHKIKTSPFSLPFVLPSELVLPAFAPCPSLLSLSVGRETHSLSSHSLHITHLHTTRINSNQHCVLIIINIRVVVVAIVVHSHYAIDFGRSSQYYSCSAGCSLW